MHGKGDNLASTNGLLPVREAKCKGGDSLALRKNSCQGYITISQERENAS